MQEPINGGGHNDSNNVHIAQHPSEAYTTTIFCKKDTNKIRTEFEQGALTGQQKHAYHKAA